MKIIETKNYKEAYLPYQKSSEEEWGELNNAAKDVMRVFNENEKYLGKIGVKCWVQKKSISQPMSEGQPVEGIQSPDLYDVLISRQGDSGRDEVTELVIDGSFKQCLDMLSRIYSNAVTKLAFKALEPPESPGPPPNMGDGGDNLQN